jgi:hypothetical protein
MNIITPFKYFTSYIDSMYELKVENKSLILWTSMSTN